jgi:polysaccharide export outer membrane protein
MRVRALFSCIVGALSLMQASSAFAQTPTAPPAPAAVATVSADTVADSDYRLGVADRVRVIVYNEPTLSGEFSVNANGSVALPLIGDVPAINRTPRELSADITSKLSADYLRNPQVSIDVLTYRPFYILGEVNKPGEYQYSTGLTVLNAVARAEGYTYRADKRRVHIKRAGAPKEEAIPLDSATPVFPGDTVRIGERFF